MVDPPICFSYFLVLASGLAGHALSSRSRVALQHGEDQKAAVRRSGDQRYQSKRSLLSGNRVITRLLPRRNPGECRATGGSSARSTRIKPGLLPRSARSEEHTSELQ